MTDGYLKNYIYNTKHVFKQDSNTVQKRKRYDVLKYYYSLRRILPDGA